MGGRQPWGRGTACCALHPPYPAASSNLGLGAGGQGRVWLGWAEPPELWFWVLVGAVGAGSLTIRLLALGMDT